MGENHWRDENTWPLESTEYVKFFLGSGGRAIVGSATAF